MKYGILVNSGILTSACITSLLFGSSALAEKCVYKADKSSLTVAWTAFKTSEKLPVGGKFTKVDVTGKGSGTSMGKMIESLKVRVDMTSLDTGNPGRDTTLSDFFFKKLTTTSAEGKIIHFKEKDGTADLELQFNGQKKVVPLKIAMADTQITATGEMDILNFSGQSAFDSIHSQCQELHKGKDGVSKTWSTVDLNLKGVFSKTCK